MRRIITIIGAAALLLALAVPALAQVNPETNKVSYWCDGENGTKYEPVDTPFIVPAPPEGKTWTLLVLKGGATNEVILLPVVGQGYSHSEHDNSHTILCWEDEEVTTTTSSTTTSSSTSTTSSTTTSSTTLPSTTTTDPGTTTSSSTTTTVGPSTTTTSTPSTTEATTTTAAPTTTTTVTTVTLPVTGPPSSLSYGALAASGLLLLTLGGAMIVGQAKTRRNS